MTFRVIGNMKFTVTIKPLNVELVVNTTHVEHSEGYDRFLNVGYYHYNEVEV